MNRLRNKFTLIFLAATVAPLAATLWMSTRLLEQSLSYMTTDDIDRLSKSLESIAREYYRQIRDDLKSEAASGRLEPQRFALGTKATWPEPLRQFWESPDQERFQLSGPDGDRLNYLVRGPSEVRVYSRSLDGVRMEELTNQYRQARLQVERLRQRDLRRGFIYTLILLSGIIWTLALVGMIFFANRISNPIESLTTGLSRLAAGDFRTRIRGEWRDEVGRAIDAFNNTAHQLEQNRDRLVYLTQIASWQTLARKMAHELKNSLTPIRLTAEEILARNPLPDRQFLDQAARVVVDEAESLERRVRAFSEFATEPESKPEPLDLNVLLKERVHFLRVAHSDVIYELRLADDLPLACADPDQINGILTNLLENAAEAAGEGGQVLGITRTVDGKIQAEVHDSGPGLSPEARRSLFEPSISFKKRGMGLGLSIARKNALQAGGDLESIQGLLSGAGFRLTLPSTRSGDAPGHAEKKQ